ncbi:MAG: branched-chain amino acid ABC transporter permease [Devosia sp.]
MELFIQYAVNALSLGGIYALIALGLAIVFSIFGFINFAHGELLTIFGYVLFYAMSAGIPFIPAVAIGLAASMLVAMLMERVAFRPMRGANPMTLLVTSFAISGALQVIFQIGFGAQPKPLPMPGYLSGAFTIGGIYVGAAQIISIVVVTVLIVALNVFLNRTKFGLALLASAQDFDIARLMGIRANAIYSVAFAISGLLAGVAAILWISLRGSVDPTMGFNPLVKAFVATIVGGMGSLTGAVAGGFFLGVMEVALQIALPPDYLIFRDPIILSTLIAFLLFRPAGLIPAARSPVK